MCCYFDYFLTRYALKSSGQPRFLHSAAMVGNMMLIFGGNKHKGTMDSKVHSKCYANDFLGYDLSKWSHLEL